MGKYCNFFIIIVLKLICVSVNKKIVIPIKLIEHSNTGLNYIESLLQNQIYAEIQLGTPAQKIYLALSTETESFSIESKSINQKFYSHNASSTHFNTGKKISFYHERYKLGNVFKDSFYFRKKFNNNKFDIYNNISFDYIFELSEEFTADEKPCYINKNKDQISGTIGLQISKSYMSSSNFLNSLSLANAIDSSIWSLVFNGKNNSPTYLIVGENLFKNNYNGEEGKRARAYISGIDSYWYFIFSDIKIGNTKINQERTAKYAPQIGVIVGTVEYKEYINQYFFSELINNNVCTEKYVSVNRKKYAYFECDKNIDINNFESISFIHQELSYNFTLDKEDLFADFNDKKYFLCVFLEGEGGYDNHWVFGIPFIKKYKFLFDHNSKEISFYDNKYQIVEEEKQGEIGWVAWIFIIILIIITALLTLYLLFKMICRPKKINANELEDSFNVNKNKKNDLDLSSFYNSKYNKLGV